MSSLSHRVHRFVSNDFTVRIAAVDATAVVREMQSIQGTKPLPTVAVGRAMVGALLMASHFKKGQQIGLLFKGNGALASVYAEASFEGQVRGYTPMGQYHPVKYHSSLNLHEAMGTGFLSVTRHLPFQKQPHHGTVEMVSGEIGDDIAHYLHQSQQIRSIVALGVYLDVYGRVKSAGGVIIEVMPGVEEEIVEQLQANAELLKKNTSLSISERILQGAQPQEIVNPYLNGIPFTELDHDYPITYFCPCNRERVERALEVMGISELEDMIKKEEPAEIICQICGRPYSLSVSEIEEIRAKLIRGTMH